MARNRSHLPLLLSAGALLAACATPQEQCISRETRELRNVQTLLAEVNGNIARGYAWDERPVSRSEWRDCTRVLTDGDGNQRLVSTPCLRDVVETERFRVAIDPAVEIRKRDNLEAKRRDLARRAEAGVRACKVAHPE